jgi:MinD-like ATPase involved in chromosome partitioning or flagellar assembly
MPWATTARAHKDGGGPVDRRLAAAPAQLTLVRPLSPWSRARQQWRSLGYLEQLDQLIAQPRLRRCATIAFVSPKGGVGKTTLTALLGTLLSHLRRDHVVAVDTNPDYGSLGRVLTPDQPWFVDDLLDVVDRTDLTLTSLDTRLGRAAHGLLVAPAPTDPERMERLDETAYLRVVGRLKGYFGVVLLDCGTGLQEPAARAAIRLCDQIVLVTDAEPATASLVAEAARLLASSDRPLSVVVNKMPSRHARLDLSGLASHLSDVRGLVVVPHQPEAASRLQAAAFDWRDAPRPWQESLRALAATLIADWPRLGLAV